MWTHHFAANIKSQSQPQSWFNRRLTKRNTWTYEKYKQSRVILHSLICRVLLLLLLLLRNASDLRNCTSYVRACMWVWYCRPPIGAHFHPTPQPPPVPQQLGEKVHLRTVAAVLANATATTLVYPSVQGPAPARRPRGPAGRCRPAGGCRPAARIAAAVYVSPELYSLPVYQEFASLRPPLGGRTRLVIIIIIRLSLQSPSRRLLMTFLD